MNAKKRLIVIAISVFFLFSLLIVKYFKIQILEGDKWTEVALSQHEFIVKEPFKRGTFYSNGTLKKGHPDSTKALVFDVPKYHLYIDPIALPKEHHREIAEVLQKKHIIDESSRVEFEKKSRSRRLSMWLDRNQMEEVLRWWTPYAKKMKIPKNGLYFIRDFQRCYPFGKLLGQVLQTVRELKDEITNQAYPTGGLEGYFNSYLQGKMGKRKLLRSPLNQLEIDKVIEEPENGADIHLTIDHCIQAIVEEELETGVNAAQAKGGWSVMMDPFSGEILALAQYPFYEPTHYRDFYNNKEKMELAKVKAITDAFELGSIMKPLTMAIALTANQELERKNKTKIFDPDDKMDVTRTIFPGRRSKPLTDASHHTALNMYMALQKSSNIYMAQVVDRIIHDLGVDWYRNKLVSLFGFGKKTQVELPAEATGMVPTPGKRHPSGALEWSTPTPYSLSIGYNILATSLQMVRAYCTLANGGYQVKPTLVKKIVKNGEVLFEHKNSEKKRVLDDSIVRKVVAGIKYTTKIGGTGALASINGYTEAGKTGTAEKIVNGVYSEERYISSFVGFTPARIENNSTRFVLIVTIDEAKPIRLANGAKNYMSGRCAAPVFREISRRTLEYLGEPPDDPHGYPEGDPRYDSEKADWIKEVKELKHLYEQWN